ncbi:CYTH domain-containing protein [Endozoicomonas numazuensis]|uniref:CYTH domain-containing protein n=1 Tax=Endozoicomonas numazuensis TaxID=1137799 RepID=UPI00069099EE|nr:CYTH domain-containing protein [Endozoicomonas numazuensis]
MSNETELKLSLPQEQVQALKTLPFWKKFANSAPEFFHLGNTYFDTASLKLNQARVALRIREKNGLYFQTLKTKGVSVNGLTRRGEWEWAIERPELDIKGLQKVWPASLGSLPSEILIPMFSTDFDRTCWLVEWSEPRARVEVALDYGYVRSGDASSVICELELELLDGDERALQSIAAQLTTEIDLKPADKSKAERGFELLQKKPDGLI